MDGMQALEALKSAVAAAGTMTKWAEAHGFSQPYVSDVVYGRRPIGPRMLMALGLEKVVTYRTASEPAPPDVP